MIENMVIRKEVTTMTVKLATQEVENVGTEKLISDMQTIFDELKTRMSLVATKFLGDLPVGALVRDSVSTYYGAPIVFLVADHGFYGKNATALVTERILTFKAFDAAEPRNTDDRRAKYGNNNYQDSNIHQWLNSESNIWFQPRHATDQAPTEEFVTSRPYADESGFLSNMGMNFRSNLAKLRLNYFEDALARVFLLSRSEIGLDDGGKVLELFKNDEFRKAKPTKECVQIDEEGNVNESDWWWLRDPNAGYSHYVRYVYTSGALSSYSAFYGSHGVRPALNLASDIRVKSEPDENGVYDIIWE